MSGQEIAREGGRDGGYCWLDHLQCCPGEAIDDETHAVIDLGVEDLGQKRFTYQSVRHQLATVLDGFDLRAAVQERGPTGKVEGFNVSEDCPSLITIIQFTFPS